MAEPKTTTTAENKTGGGPWIPLESNPDVFNSWARKLGMANTAHFEDIYGLDPELLAMVTKPVKAVLMIFPISPQMEASRKTDDEAMRKDGLSPNISPHIMFIEQKIGNACGTIGLLHALLNSDVTIGPTSSLAQFQEKCDGLSPCDRADLLAKTTLFAKAHSEAATSRESDSTVPTKLDTDLHFTCFLQAVDGADSEKKRLIELDGRRVGPVDHGDTDDVLKDVSKVMKEKYLKLSTSMQFGLVALCGR
ncbi:ubiquitinyl hydrolase 1 [Tulasnella sp. JGI-2019a]|nr:ubiquitinyl hydrolase 1 [Tulasnella sp. JGI-2019a]